MSTIAAFNLESADGTDAEHRVQLALLHSLCGAVRDGAAATTVDALLRQLVAYSEAHFASEELLMRLNSYDDYEAHVDEHARMMDALQDTASACASGRPVLDSGPLEAIRESLGQHIATQDRRFAEFMRGGERAL